MYKKAQLELKRGKYNDAIVFYEELLKKNSEDIYADDALFKLADINENQLKNNDKAKELYQQLLEKYPGSLYVVEARKRFRKLEVMQLISVLMSGKKFKQICEGLF